MKKTLIFLFLILIWAYRISPCYAFSQNFQISVTIPAIPGINIALETQSSLPTDLPADTKAEEQSQEKVSPAPKIPTILEIIEKRIIEAEEITYITLIER